MPWVRKDDRMPWHRKVAPLSDAAYRLLDEAICWSSTNLTDGRIRRAELADISKRGKPKNATELVDRDLWHPAGTDCVSDACPPSGPDGWVIHDYWDYQPSKAKVLREREAKAERQRRWLEAKTRGRNGTSTDGAIDVSRDVSRDGNPAPSRPAPKEGGGGAPAATAARRQAAGAGDGGRDEQSIIQRLTGSPDYDAIEQRAVRGDRRAHLAELARAALPPDPRRPRTTEENGHA